MPISPFAGDHSVYRDQIYQSLRGSFIDDSGDSTFATDDASVESETSVWQALLWGSATAMGMAEEQLERAGANRNPATAVELLALLEQEYQVVPRYNASIAERQATLAARAAVTKGASRTAIEETLTAMLGADFVAYEAAEDVQKWPTSPGDVGIFDVAAAERKIFRLLDHVSITGVPRTVRYELLGDSNRPIVGEEFCVDPDARSRPEKVTISEVTSTTITATFASAHDVNVLACRPHPLWLSTRRYNRIILTFSAATNPDIRQRVNDYMSRVLRGVSGWCVIHNQGGFRLGHATRSRLNSTSFAGYAGSGGGSSGFAAGFAQAKAAAFAFSPNVSHLGAGIASATSSATGVGGGSGQGVGSASAKTSVIATSKFTIWDGKASATTSVTAVGAATKRSTGVANAIASVLGQGGPLTLRIDSFGADGTWNRPALGSFCGLTGSANRARVELWGAGAGGTAAVGGGGGGAYSRVDDLDVSSAASFAIAGLAGAAANTNGTDATFGATLVVAKGGLSGANGGTGGQAAACTGDTKLSGGNGTAGSANTAGGGGAGSATAGSSSTGGSPEGGSSTANANGRIFSSGGGSSAASGFAGANGRARIAYQAVAQPGYPRLAAYTLDRSVGTSHGVVVPSGTQVGDVLVWWVVADGNVTISSGGSATEICTGISVSNVRGSAFYRVATGVDSFSFTTSATSRLQISCFRFAGAGTPEGTAATGDSTNADPPNHTSSGGSVKGIWLALAGWDASAEVVISAAPANYGNWLTMGPAGVTGVFQSVSMRELEAASENPGAYTSGPEQWVAATVLVRAP